MKTKFILGLAASLLVITGFKERPKNLFKLKKGFTENFAYIPNGDVTLEEQKIKTGAFYIFKTEVSNLQYREFLNSLNDNGSNKNYAVKSKKWTESEIYLEPYQEHYSSHPAYENYPVVNVTKEGAEAFCKWLTEVYADKEIGLPEGYKLVFRLPTRAEWTHAANGELAGPYAWGGPFLRNAKGQQLANFSSLGAENIHMNPETGEFEVVSTIASVGVAGALNDRADILAPINSYAPNRYGLVNMNGNAAELLADTDQAAGGSWRCPGYDIRNESLMNFEEASPEVGFRPIGVISKVN
ncbi:MAG: formylglycine-generating enzyme family protein [Flavobacteriales bacterium]|nr:formylglycine-generating enzyme family protein [Flavobacteriales bacterium]